ncbi:hypothetical protein ABZ527_31530 [Streptomyces griseofuscus]|uniref:hypothetical protein n=1 Tax=Streptomyces griseofuscus TaxID=146922 RepID=UPI00340F1858
MDTSRALSLAGRCLGEPAVDCAAETAADRLGDSLDNGLAACGEGAGRIRLRLDIERITDGTAENVGHHIMILGTKDTTHLPHTM